MLADNISLALAPTAIGLLVGTVGTVFMGIALLGYRYRAPWFFWFLICYASLWILTTFAKVATIPGVALLVYLIVKKNEFHLNEPQNPEMA